MGLNNVYMNILVLGIRMRIMCSRRVCERPDEMVKHGRDDVKDFEDVSGTLCCPPPVLFTAQRAKLSRVFSGQNYLQLLHGFHCPWHHSNLFMASSPLLCSLPTTMPCWFFAYPVRGPSASEVTRFVAGAQVFSFHCRTID